MWRPSTARNDPPSPTPANQSLPNAEVSERPKRRRFPAAYKLRIVQEADVAVEFGQVGALLRREGLYSSQLAAWRSPKRSSRFKKKSQTFWGSF